MASFDIGRAVSARIGEDGFLHVENADAVPVDFKEQQQRNILVFEHFLRMYRDDDNSLVYREQLTRNIHNGRYFVEIRFEHLRAFAEDLADALVTDPSSHLRDFDKAAVNAAVALDLISDENPLGEVGASAADTHAIQVLLFGHIAATPIRTLDAASVSGLVAIPGIVVSSSRPACRVRRATVQCSSCKKLVEIPAINGKIELPKKCVASAQGNRLDPGAVKCRDNPYVIVPDSSCFFESQSLRLQEVPEEVPCGEMPRSTGVGLERCLVDRVKAGFRVTVIGISMLASGQVQAGRGAAPVAGLKKVFVRAVGLMIHSGCNLSSACTSFVWRGGLTTTAPTSTLAAAAGLAATIAAEGGPSATSAGWRESDEAMFMAMAKEPHLYEKIARSIDPMIHGLQDVRKAIALQLFGGVRKRLPEGPALRGDIHILLVGDPSTAKSQLLRFSERLAPVGVYVSGKGSSAAGLTAAVLKDRHGDFCLEGGSLVIADGGLCCIDEFDKMRHADQVAIHEALEQQTVSVSKAGIQASVNARSSVLAAANPMFGSYDDLHATDEQIEFSSSILSRFDLIFQVLDEKDGNRDMALARHVINVHKTSGKRQNVALNANSAVQSSAVTDTFDIATLRSYIAYARASCHPKLDTAAHARLRSFFVDVRRHQNTAITALDAALPGGSSAPTSRSRGPIRITVRQLEAIIRLAEAQARMHLRKIATTDDVDEAVRLFNVATVQAMRAGTMTEEGLSPEARDDLVKIEGVVRQRLPVGQPVQTERLRQELSRWGFEDGLVIRSLFALARRGDLEFRQKRRLVVRKA